MSHYFDNTEETENTLKNGWLNTGDIGFLIDGRVHITGRQKDLIIVNGRNIWPQDIEHLAEQQPEIRTGDALAFSAPGFDAETTVVLVMQCRERDQDNRDDIVKRVEADIKEEIGVSCFIKLVPPHTLPRTSSGKLSRSAARRDYMEQNSINESFLTEPRNTSVSNNH
jgi:fatty-acyl-CoA synthase